LDSNPDFDQRRQTIIKIFKQFVAPAPSVKDGLAEATNRFWKKLLYNEKNISKQPLHGIDGVCCQL
jgi:hypothetical protein